MSKVTFERIDKSSRLDKKKLREIGYGVARVIRISYERAFEQQQTKYLLPAGTIKREVDDEDNPKWVKYAAKRVRDASSGGSVYDFAWEDGEITGLVKTSPSQPTGYTQDNLYLNDIAVIHEGQGLGSKLMAMALAGHEPEKLVVLDAFDGNDRANGWYERLGYEPTDPQPEDNFWVFEAPEVNGVVVPQIRMQALAGHVRAHLAKRI